jgi:hypothetical protein
MGYLVAAVALLRPYARGLTGFEVVLLLLQQNRKYEVVHPLAYLPRLGIAVRPNGEFGRVSGNSTDHFQAANAIAELYSRICSLQLFASLVSPVSSFHNRSVKQHLHRPSCELVPTGEERKHI